MPPGAYTSAELLELELEEIFAKEWMCVGRVEEIPAVGDYFAIEVAGEPLIVVRSKADEIRALANVCRHKWTRLADGRGQTRRFACPYHAWTYDLQGCLVHARYMETSAGFDPAEHSLPQVRSEIWRGFIYVNIDGAARAIEDRLAELDARTGDYHMEEMHRVCGDEEVWATNWKLLVENFTDLYHTFYAHRNSIGRYSPMELITPERGGAGYSFGSSAVLKDAMEESPFEPVHPELSEKHRNEFSMVGVFPAQMLALAPDRVFYMCLEPVDVDHVRTKWGVACYDPNPSTDTVDAMDALYRQVNDEDRANLERVQSALRSRHAGQGRISRYENMNWEFTRYIAERIGR